MVQHWSSRSFPSRQESRGRPRHPQFVPVILWIHLPPGSLGAAGWSPDCTPGDTWRTRWPWPSAAALRTGPFSWLSEPPDIPSPPSIPVGLGRVHQRGDRSPLSNCLPRGCQGGPWPRRSLSSVRTTSPPAPPATSSRSSLPTPRTYPMLSPFCLNLSFFFETKYPSGVIGHPRGLDWPLGLCG